MATVIDEGVDVVAICDPNIRPVKFRWKGRVHEIGEVTHTWRTMEGEARIIHFSVTDDSALYELAYNSRDTSWRLKKVEPCL